MRKRVAAPLFALLSITLLGIGWVLAFVFQSGAQREAAASAPQPHPVTSQVFRGTLEQTMSARADVGREVNERLPLPHVDDTSVITRRTISAGDDVQAGSPLLEINGRPLFVFAGAFPFYRDLEPGMDGPDVAQLQSALSASGHPVSVDGRLGSETVAAVTALYSAAGYNPPSVSTPAPVEQGIAPSEMGSATHSLPSPTLRIPQSELLVVSQTPCYLVEAPALGQVVTPETTVTLEYGKVVAVAEIAAAAGGRLEQGMAVHLDDGRGEKLLGEVASVGDVATVPPDSSKAPAAGRVESNGSSASSALRLVFSGADGGSLPEKWLHTNVLAVISIRLVATDSLIVASIAVVPNGNGPPVVYKRLSDGSFRAVDVKEEAVFEGKSAIRPVSEGQIDAGDVVRVG
ncbi:peptidoglycan-binding domain-containing protein [Leifsonia sp. NPDC080035]|uniref:Peptidoglycan-binding domain-containing protein n=1 Tax=Leifsonia sp. NPDC080035 TaxID=3143936 RepID=A0AAU7GH26_9MICO